LSTLYSSIRLTWALIRGGAYSIISPLEWSLIRGGAYLKGELIQVITVVSLQINMTIQ